MKKTDPEIESLLKGNRYPGRGIVLGESADGRCACFAYFIMGRSENSRNRVLEEAEGALYTRPFDESKVQDPSLIIYPAMRAFGKLVIVTNGDQTDTIFAAIKEGKSFFEGLESRTYEPDAPNYTPRISALLDLTGARPAYQMSILKRGSAGERIHERFAYEATPGVGHLLHTYRSDGDPLPSFAGEPRRLALPSSIDAFAERLWASLDPENKISLFVRYICLATGRVQTRIFNKNQRSDL